MMRRSYLDMVGANVSGGPTREMSRTFRGCCSAARSLETPTAADRLHARSSMRR